MAHSLTPSSSFAAGSHLRVDGLSFSYPDRRVLTDVSFVVPAGDRVGLIGENGSGKSTLLKVIAAALEPSAGTVSVDASRPHEPSIGLLHQEPPFSPEETIAEALESAVAPCRRAVEAVRDLGAAIAADPEDHSIGDGYSRALETAERRGAWDVDSRISAMLAGLGLAQIDRQRCTNTLSGGQRARFALAWLLLSAPDVLLLDEPTNHLDDDATAYLVSVLSSWRGPLVLASHDRVFLDETITSLIDLDPAPIPHSVAGSLVQDGPGSGIGVTRFSGSYSDYLVAREEARVRWERQYRDEQAELSRLRSAVITQQTVGHSDWRPRSEVRMAKKFYADRNAKVVARRVNDARGRLDGLETQQIRKPPRELRFRGLVADGSRGSGPLEPVLAATDVALSGRLQPTSISISRGEKWLVTGANGSGKSTLFHLLAGRLEPTGGHIARSPTDRIGLLSQETVLSDHHDRGDTRTAAEVYSDLVGPDRAHDVPLSSFGLITGRDQNRPIRELSVGQQRRLALAALLSDPPEILLLDEPTNHFSLLLVAAIEEGLSTYPGTVIVATHDRWLRRRWEGHHVEITGHAPRHWHT